MALFFNIVKNNYNSIFIFYLIIAAGYIANIFGCAAQKLFERNMLIKHIVGVFTLYFFIILEDPHKPQSIDEYVFFKKLGATICIYLVFILSSRTKDIYFNSFLIILAILFLLKKYNESLDENIFKERIETIKMYMTWLSLLSFLLILIGFVIYYIEKKHEYKNKFEFGTFLIGNKKCKSMI